MNKRNLNVKKNIENKYEYKIHIILVVFIYIGSYFISKYILELAMESKETSTLLIVSTGAILATFGSAIATIGGIWEKDLIVRIIENVDILFVDLLKQEKWRRWPFLARRNQTKQLDGTKTIQTLDNPQLPLDVGTHILKIDIPTVLNDFFDLSIIKNTYNLIRFRNAARTTNLNKDKNDKCSETEMTPFNQYMAYECIFDIWISILIFRFFRYLTHIGVGLTILGTFNTVFAIINI